MIVFPAWVYFAGVRHRIEWIFVICRFCPDQTLPCPPLNAPFRLVQTFLSVNDSLKQDLFFILLVLSFCMPDAGRLEGRLSFLVPERPFVPFVPGGRDRPPTLRRPRADSSFFSRSPLAAEYRPFPFFIGSSSAPLCSLDCYSFCVSPPPYDFGPQRFPRSRGPFTLPTPPAPRTSCVCLWDCTRWDGRSPLIPFYSSPTQRCGESTYLLFAFREVIPIDGPSELASRPFTLPSSESWRRGTPS